MSGTTLEPFVGGVLAALGSGVAGSVALAGAVWLGIRVCRLNATTRHALWSIALMASAVLPAVCLCTSLTRIEYRTVAAIDPRIVVPLRPASARSTVGSAPMRPDANQPASRAQSATPISFASAPLRAAFLWSVRCVTAHFAFAALALWLIVVAARTVALGRRVLALHVLKADAPLLDPTIARRLRRWRHRHGTGRTVALRVSTAVDVPVAVGFRRPAIMLPLRVVRDASAADLDQIVLHEHAHLNRYDDWTNLMECAIASALWFNPVIWFLLHRISLEREIACDDRVIAQTGRTHRYATCLWNLVRTSSLPSSAVLAPGVLFTSKQLATRIERLLDPRRDAVPRLSPTMTILIALVGIAAVVLQMQRAPAIALTSYDVRRPQPLRGISPAPLRSVPAPAPSAAPSAAPPARRSPLGRSPFPSRIASPAVKERNRGGDRQKRLQRRVRTAPQNAYRTGRHAQAAVRRANLKRNVTGAVASNDVTRLRPKLSAQIAGTVRSATSHATFADAFDTTGESVRDLPAFHRIVFDTDIRVEIRRSPRSRIDFGGGPDQANQTTSEVAADTLTISGSGPSDEPSAAITIETPSLDDVQVDGSSDVYIDDVQAQHLTLTMSGSGTIVVAGGSARDGVVDDEGSGNIDLGRLHTASLTASSEGSGDITLSAPRRLAVTIDGSGDVAVHGRAESMSTRINGSGRIIQR